MSDNDAKTKAIVSDAVLSRSVQEFPDSQRIPGTDGTFTLFVSSFADDITAWGRSVDRRDKELREFWPTEPFLASAINSIVQARANMSWTLDGPPRTVNVVQKVLQSSDVGSGWQSLQQKTAIDLLTADNGAFVEIVRLADSENSPVINLAHLDSAQCTRTGQPETPVIYYDLEGKAHLLKWYQVLSFEDMPSPIESMHGVQYSFLTRVLRAAQIIKDIGIFKREKISGRNPSEIHFVGGVQTKRIEDKLRDEAMSADNQGYTRFQTPLVLGSLDPNAPVSVATIAYRSVPDGFDEDVSLRWYVAQLALGAGADYQDFAPLPSGNIGTGQQSEVLHRKGKGKGHETWRKMWEHKLNFHGILPRSVTFSFEEDDTQAKQEEAELQETQSKTFSTYFKEGILPLPVIHQMMQDEGILKPEYMSLLGEQDVTSTIIVDDEEPAPTQQELTHAETIDPEDVEKALYQLDGWVMSSLEIQPPSKKKDEQDRASTQFNMKGDIAEIHSGMLQMFGNDMLHESGVEDEAHITVLYGLEDDTVQDVFEIALQFEPFEIKFGDISLFQSDEFDVVKVEVESPKLRELNGAFAQLPFENDHQSEGYNPHMTLAYVLPGIGAGFVGPCGLTGKSCIVDELTFSTSDRNIIKIPLGQSHDTKQDEEEIDEDIEGVEDELATLALLLQDEEITQSEFQERMAEITVAAILAAFLLGSNKTEADLTPDELAAIREQAEIDATSIQGLSDDIEAGNFTEEGGQDLGARLSVWGKTVAGMVALGQLAKPITVFLQWNLGIADHCVTCIGLDGVIRTVAEWAETPFRPQARNGSLACGGWECKCFWTEVEGPRQGRLPSPAG